MNAILKVRWTVQSVGFLAASIPSTRTSHWSTVQHRVPEVIAMRAMRQKRACRRATAHVATKRQLSRALVATLCWRSFRALEAYTRDLSLSELPASASADLARGMVNNVLAGTSHDAYSIALAPLKT